MKAKRAKQQRKIMQIYQMHYAFREPYQVLVSSDCLRAVHAFAMPIHKFLQNTLQGEVMPYITQCTLAKVMEGYSGKGRDGRPVYLPPPTEVPLRYCKHKNEEGKEEGVIPEADCLMDLLSGQAKGNEQKKNKHHYVLAAADYNEGIKDEKERERLEVQRRKRRKLGNPDVDVRDRARMVPGVPIIYVKRSVMVLEEPAISTTRAIRSVEKEKFKDGVGGAVRGTKRGRDEDDSESDNETIQPNKSKGGNGIRAKAPNPLSVRKKKVKTTHESRKSVPNDAESSEMPKKRRRGKRGKGTDPVTLLEGQAVEAD